MLGLVENLFYLSTFDYAIIHIRFVWIMFKLSACWIETLGFESEGEIRPVKHTSPLIKIPIQGKDGERDERRSIKINYWVNKQTNKLHCWLHVIFGIYAVRWFVSDIDDCWYLSDRLCVCVCTRFEKSTSLNYRNGLFWLQKLLATWQESNNHLVQFETSFEVGIKVSRLEMDTMHAQ